MACICNTSQDRRCPVHDRPTEPAAPAPGHSWHDYGQQNGRNRSWCSRCKLVAWTGEEPDSPCVSMPMVAADGVPAAYGTISERAEQGKVRGQWEPDPKRHTTKCSRYDNNCGAVHPSNCPDCPFRTPGVLEVPRG